jgi:hypothetical protein
MSTRWSADSGHYQLPARPPCGSLLALGATVAALVLYLPGRKPAYHVPAAFAGTWNGQLSHQGRTNAAASFTASLSLASGTSPGTITYSGQNFSCTAHLTAMTVQGKVLTVRQTAPANQRRGATDNRVVCNDGTLVLTLSGTARLAQSPPVLIPTMSMVYQYRGHSDAEGALIKAAV